MFGKAGSKTSNKLIRVLSLDGGGIRGIVPAIVLDQIEDRTGKPICELFHIIAGTSTGGILALGLTRPDPVKSTRQPKYSATDVIKMYEEMGKRIFSRHLLSRIPGLGMLLWDTHEERYPSKGIEGVLDKFFGNTKVSEALTEVVITCYDIEERRPYFFTREDGRQKSRDLLMKNLARATTAAPTFFEPARIPKAPLGEHYALVDGGVVANNPSVSALIEARKMFGDKHKLGFDDYLVVSIGTGEYTRRISYDRAKRWGLIGWGQNVINVIFDGMSDAANYQLKNMLREDRYYRFQADLHPEYDEMDDARDDTIEYLKEFSGKLIEKENEKLNELCEVLKQLPEPAIIV